MKDMRKVLKGIADAIKKLPPTTSATAKLEMDSSYKFSYFAGAHSIAYPGHCFIANGKTPAQVISNIKKQIFEHIKQEKENA